MLTNGIKNYYRNFDRFGLGIIQSGLSLGFHHQFRRELIDKIFNVEFLDYIDEEIQNTYGKVSEQSETVKCVLI